MLYRTFSDDDSEEDSAAREPEYSFAGYNVEFSEKIALTPAASAATSKAQSRSRAFILDPKNDKLDEMPRAEFERIERDADRSDARKKIIDLAAGSAVARFRWPGRGVAPGGYIKGMALTYARVYCKLKGGDAAATEMAKAATTDASRDALAHYASEFRSAGMANDVAGADTLRHVFVLLVGLGMRESSGQYCMGRDPGASNTSGDTAEAGLFQTSFNARAGNSLMEDLFRQYKDKPAGYVEVFKEGVSCSAANLKDWGTGDGKEYQRLAKAAPAFAAEFTAVGLRNIRRHWGPINTKTAEINADADALLLQVQNLVDQSNLCPLLQD
ncbi:MAG TPA: hypothetical protein VF297_08815 [Pyrinomonadaceae bacterium]